jgi:hypothetical protein
MKKFLPYLLLAIAALACNSAGAQWCVPTTAIPYDADMPGITRFIFNTIDRQSADCENYPHNNYVNTGLSTDINLGQTYNTSISFTVDASICPDMNLRVWIDFNHDGQLDDIGETVLTANNQLPSTYNGTITIPTTAMTGITRMRVTAKMTPTGGHTMPTPCDNPPDPFGYHGEIEDYTVNIVDASGINTVSDLSGFYITTKNNIPEININLDNSSDVSVDIFNIEGQKIQSVIQSQKLAKGLNSFIIDKINSPGIYFAEIILNGKPIVKKFSVE